MRTYLRTAALAATLSAGAFAAQAEVTIDVLHAWPGHRHFHEDVAEAFMAQHPDIKVNFLAAAESYDTEHQAVVRDAVTGNLPDIVFSGYHLLPELIRQLQARGLDVPLKPFIDAEGGDGWISANHAPSMINLTTVEGQIYALPFNASTPIIFFNKDLIEQAGGDASNLPDTWDGWIELAGKIDALGDTISGMSYSVDAWPDDWLWRALISQQGKPFMAEDGQSVAWDNEVGKSALELARRFVTEGGMVQMDFSQARQQFAAGLTGFTIQSVNSARSFEELAGDKFTVGTDIFPVSNKDSGKVPTGGNGGLITTQDPEQQAAAWEYIKFAASPEGQKLAVLGSGYMPTNKLAMAPDLLGDFYAANPNWATSLRQLDRATPWAGYPGTNAVEIWRTQRDIIAEVMSGDLDVEDGLEELADETNSLIGR
ncbi:ABC transporter substrate-binding protein [Antarcticimicrobium sediminis]|uniref:ABC transporter substrate-binding protein n=1 Tax=Antarcticimicrobium sediminis TaxID=2546227 RepID=A0A4R5EJ10_9RHOB|nr:ABC transporter substrate-binding protein [Antarcticimicrobium sediminis]TDE34499.1 ABC transporter substrate-binding protein [Antarcticimicrobium sediminis]